MEHHIRIMKHNKTRTACNVMRQLDNMGHLHSGSSMQRPFYKTWETGYIDRKLQCDVRQREKVTHHVNQKQTTNPQTSASELGEDGETVGDGTWTRKAVW